MSDDPIKRAERVRVLLNDPLVLEAREHMRDSLTRAAWKRHELSDADARRLDAYMKHYESFFAWFERVMQDGRIAEADIQAKGRLARIAERIKN